MKKIFFIIFYAERAAAGNFMKDRFKYTKFWGDKKAGDS